MDVIVISSSDKFKSEIPHVINLLDAGLEIFHLRKPKFTYQRFEEYLDQIPQKYHNKIVVHSFHALAKKYNLRGIHLTRRHKKKRFKTVWRCFLLRISNPNLTVSTSCHDLTRLADYSKKYNYVFLSPVYDSISKGGKQAGYAYGTIKKTLSGIEKNNVFALGGVNSSKINDTKLLGFNGIALLGAIWNSKTSPLETFKEAVDVELGRIKQGIEIHPVKITL